MQDFSQDLRSISTAEEWHRLTYDQPWTPARRRQLLLRFLHAKLCSASDVLALEGGTGPGTSTSTPTVVVEQQEHVPLVPSPQAAPARVAGAGAKGMWELTINKEHHASFEPQWLTTVVQKLGAKNLEVGAAGTQPSRAAGGASRQLAAAQHHLCRSLPCTLSICS